MFRRPPLLRFLLLLVIGYAALCAGIFFWQRNLLYFPRPLTVAEARELAGDALVPVEIGGRIVGWSTPGSPASPPILVFHGNTGYAVDRTLLVEHLQAAAPDRRIVVLEYPGYGVRDGEPTEASLIAAAEELLLTLPAPVVLVGESLGTGVASALAARQSTRVQGVVLITPYTRIADIGLRRYPFLPIPWLLRDRFDSLAHLPQFPGPVAFLIAGQDTITHTDLALRLAEAFPGPKKIWLLPEAGHNDMVRDLTAPQWRDILTFVTAPASSGLTRQP